VGEVALFAVKTALYGKVSSNRFLKNDRTHQRKQDCQRQGHDDSTPKLFGMLLALPWVDMCGENHA
jgi:hypothetical protein